MPVEEHRDNLFFFQAEAGIRDLYVTGVQTCALPIFYERARSAFVHPRLVEIAILSVYTGARMKAEPRAQALRSEERRVGKEGRARWPREQETKRGGGSPHGPRRALRGRAGTGDRQPS